MCVFVFTVGAGTLQSEESESDSVTREKGRRERSTTEEESDSSSFLRNGGAAGGGRACPPRPRVPAPGVNVQELGLSRHGNRDPVPLPTCTGATGGTPAGPGSEQGPDQDLDQDLDQDPAQTGWVLCCFNGGGEQPAVALAFRPRGGVLRLIGTKWSTGTWRPGRGKPRSRKAELGWTRRSVSASPEASRYFADTGAHEGEKQRAPNRRSVSERQRTHRRSNSIPMSFDWGDLLVRLDRSPVP